MRHLSTALDISKNVSEHTVQTQLKLLLWTVWWRSAQFCHSDTSLDTSQDTLISQIWRPVGLSKQIWYLKRGNQYKRAITWYCYFYISVSVTTPQPLYKLLVGSIAQTVLVKQPCYIQQKCIDYIEKWPFMVIFQYNLYIFGIHLWTVLYPKLCYNKSCYKEVVVYFHTVMFLQKAGSVESLIFSRFLFPFGSLSQFWFLWKSNTL